MKIYTRNVGKGRWIIRLRKPLSTTLTRASYCNIDADGPSLSVSLNGNDGKDYELHLTYADVDWLVASKQHYQA